MNFSLEIVKIIEGALKKDDEKVINYTKLLIDNLNKDGEEKFANLLVKTLNSSRIKEKVLSSQAFNVPLDKESRLPIADIFFPDEMKDIKVFLNNENQEQIDLFLKYYENRNNIIKEGYNIPNSLLFYGPPGTGKTVLAKYLAYRIGLPIVIARLDGLISSYLGSTAKNIRQLFEFAQRTPCILFLDEFDAVAKVRDDTHELGELKRVVNSLLQNIDALNNGSIVMAATNHEHLLDPAVWRRFSFKLRIEKPDEKARGELIYFFLKDKKFLNKNIDILISLFDGLTGAEIEEICEKARIISIIKNENISLQHLVEQYFIFINTKNKKIKINSYETDKDAIREKMIFLRNKNNKLFSYSQLSIIFNVSKSYISVLLNQKEE